MLRRVEFSAQRSARMIARAALLSRVSEHPQSSFTLVDLTEFIPECVSEIQTTLDRRITASVSLGANLKPIPADELLLGQLLLELALNAQDAMRRGGQFTLEVECITITREDLPAHPDALCGEFVRLRASDTAAVCGRKCGTAFSSPALRRRKPARPRAWAFIGPGGGRSAPGLDRVFQQAELRHAVRHLFAVPAHRRFQRRCRADVA